MTEREQFEAWARNNGLIYESHGLLSVSSSLELPWKVWQAARAQPAQAGAEPVVVPEDVIAGALYDFLGYLTSRRTRITMSDRDDAGAAVDALVDWSKTRKIRLEDACVKNWEKYTHPPARVPLTDEEIEVLASGKSNHVEFAHAIIAAYEAKNGIGGGK